MGGRRREGGGEKGMEEGGDRENVKSSRLTYRIELNTEVYRWE